MKVENPQLIKIQKECLKNWVLNGNNWYKEKTKQNLKFQELKEKKN